MPEIGYPPENGVCEISNKVAVLIGPVVPIPDGDDITAADYRAVGGCCLTEFQDIEYGKSTVVEPGCISLNCDPDAEEQPCGEAHADSQPGSANESSFSFETPHVPGAGNSEEYFQSLIGCCEKHAWKICYAGSDGSIISKIIPCGFVTGYAPTATNEDSGKPKATVTVSLCAGAVIHQ